MPQSPTGRVFVSGMFDMANFGDLLFPLVAAQALGRPVVAVAPTSTKLPFADAMAPISFEEFAAQCTHADTVLIGGGHIIHTHSLDSLPNYSAANVDRWGGVATWYGASLVAAYAGASIIWNAPGVPHPLPPDRRPLMAAALEAADYVSLRDENSASKLPCGDGVEAHVVPDTIAGITRLWSKDDLAQEAAAFKAAHGLGDARLWTLQIRDRSLSLTPLDSVAEGIDALAAKFGLVPVLCAVGQAHDDDGTARRIAKHMTCRHVVLDRPPTLRHLAGVLAHSTVHCGSSLHAYMVAACYGVPAVLLGRPSYRKFSGFLAHSGASGDLASHWDEVFAAIPSRIAQPRGQGMPQSVFDALDDHWRTIRAIIDEGNTREAQRAAFMAAHLRNATASLSPQWLLEPFAARVRQMRQPVIEFVRSRGAQIDDGAQ